MITVLTVPCGDLMFAEMLLLHKAAVQIIGTTQAHFLFSTEICESVWRNVKSVPVIECHRFATEAKARQWCAEQEAR